MSVLSVLLFLFHLLWCVVEVHSQAAPYLTFMGEILPNNSYVDLSLVGQGGNATRDSGREIVCHTDLDTCCSGSDGHGDWFFPHNHPAVERRGRSIFMKKLHKRVRLQRVPGTSGPIPSGIYHCSIETVAVSGEGGTGRERVYVGLYESGGRIHSNKVQSGQVGHPLHAFCSSSCVPSQKQTEFIWERALEVYK